MRAVLYRHPINRHPAERYLRSQSIDAERIAADSRDCHVRCGVLGAVRQSAQNLCSSDGGLSGEPKGRAAS